MKTTYSLTYLRATAALLALAMLTTSIRANDSAFAATGAATLSDQRGAHFNVNIAGEATHLGDFVAVLRIKATHTSTGSGSLVGANGDQIDVKIETEFDPELFGQVGTFVITGGTGRFAGASGGGAFVALVTALDPVETLD